MEEIGSSQILKLPAFPRINISIIEQAEVDGEVKNPRFNRAHWACL
jgi:hypothetical protein